MPQVSEPLTTENPQVDEANEDPLNSPYPVPWNWVMKTQNEYAMNNSSGLRYYRSPALVSPDGQYAAYSRIEMRAEPELYNSKVVSVVFLENLKTGKLQVIRAESPIATYLEKAGQESEEMAGVISMLMPISWSADGDRLLARQLEGAFSSSDVSDYGVVWNRQTHQVQTLSASPNNDEDISNILLGWNQNAPDQVLFRTSNLGDETEQLVSVNLNGNASLANTEDAIIYGQIVNRSWTGAQAIR
ncbi:MAG: hypothetical protein KA717_12310 [Woronichinia naegeliana WA131]|uniref:Uncharacterized protein n=1 Tax=Woronichinia naegeliana WA131 TaxID=2824559 RepID=A0A977PZD6_9CYAN|nr:MAG: hypothetical protein KA717_12310 [Woronichinia naegeliana WA131]